MQNWHIKHRKSTSRAQPLRRWLGSLILLYTSRPTPMNPVCDTGTFCFESELTDYLAAVLFSRKHPVELVIFCGSPGSGKSTYFWNNLKPLGYERVNQDLLKTVRTSHAN